MFLPGLGLSSYLISKFTLPAILIPPFIALAVLGFPIWLILIMIAALIYPKQQILELAFVALALEGMLEAAPQALLQCVYLMNGNLVTPTIIFAIVTSVFTVTKTAVQFHYWAHHIHMKKASQQHTKNEESISVDDDMETRDSSSKEKTIRDIFMMGFFHRDYWWFFAHFATSFLFRGGCLVFMITYISFGTILPCALVIGLVTYEFATGKSLCCRAFTPKGHSNYVYSHNLLFTAFAMGVTNLCIMGKGKFGADANFYKVSSSFIFAIYSVGIAVSLYIYSTGDSPHGLIVIVSFSGCVILSGIVNLVLVWLQMMCLCVCHKKHIQKSIRLEKCVCECKDRVDISFQTLKKVSVRLPNRMSLSKTCKDDDNCTLDALSPNFQSNKEQLHDITNV